MEEQVIFINVSDEMIESANEESIKRNPHIVHHFEVSHLSSKDRDIVGFLGEFCACEMLGINWKKNIRDNYYTIDSQDGIVDNLVFDVKTETIPDPYFSALLYREIHDNELYGRRLITQGQVGLLSKYDLVIFGMFKRDDYTKWYPLGYLETDIILSKYKATRIRPDGGQYPIAGMPIRTSELKDINILIGGN